MLADWVEVVEVEAVICGVLDCVVVDWHAAQPADCMLCLALCEECCFVFLELAAGLTRSSWHVVTALVLRAGVEPAHGVGCIISYHGHSKNHEAMAGLVSVLGICAIPCALTAELPKLDMNNGPAFRLNHFTNIRQYSISTVTVKLRGQLAEVELVLPLVFRRRGVRQFAAFEPLADEVA